MKYDKRKSLSKEKILILEFYFIHFRYLHLKTIAFKLGIKKIKLDKILKEWNDNDNFIIVESKINKECFFI